MVQTEQSFTKVEATKHKVMGSGWIDENKLIWINYGLDEIEKICGSEVVR